MWHWNSCNGVGRDVFGKDFHVHHTKELYSVSIDLFSWVRSCGHLFYAVVYVGYM